MSSIPISPERIARIAGFGMGSAADGYVYRPTSVDEVRAVFQVAEETGRKVVLRGAGRSYGDASILPEALVLDITKMNRVLSWNKESGVIEAEAGLTIEGLWRHTLEDGWWPPVVSGTMYPTLAGVLAMNIHGKNAFAVGPIGNHVLEFDIVLPSGELRTVKKGEELFYAVISGAGLLGVITRVKLQMKRVHSGDLRVLPISAKGWDDQFATLLEFDDKADYMVSWVDCFAKGSQAGRGLLHIAWYQDEGSEFPSSLKQSHQDLPDTVMGFMPKSMVWRFLKKLNRRFGMRMLNWAKHVSSKKLGNGKPYSESLVGFSFLLDYVPNWRWAYLPGGFIQYQSFVPKEHAKQVFAEQVRMMQEAKMEAFLGVLKRHKADDFLLSHGVDGFSFALDFKVTKNNWPKLEALCHRMNDLVLKAGGRFYFAKDSTLRPSDLQAYLGEDTIAKFRALKRELDPKSILYSSLAERVGLLK